MDTDLQILRAIKVLGKGALGTVFLVYNHSCDPTALHPFALKVLDKSFPGCNSDAYRRAQWEVSVLQRLRDNPHPFLPTLLGSFESQDFHCWAFPFCPGGDLHVLRYRQSDHVFSQSVIRFYLAEIVCALEHLHGLGIVYRDLKPENILIQQSGHVTLTDFDLSCRLLLPPRTSKSLSISSGPETDCQTRHHHRRSFKKFIATASQGNNTDKKDGRLRKGKSARVSPVSRKKQADILNGERSNSFVGTQEYVAPEVVRGEGHEFAVDWWALGVLSYEMLYGTTPFRGKDRKDTFRRTLKMPPKFIGKSDALTDLIGKLLEKDPTLRLGYERGACEIKEHDFFRGLRWDLLTEISRPPILSSTVDWELTEGLTERGFDVKDYFEKLKVSPSTLRSPSLGEHGQRSESLTEF